MNKTNKIITTGLLGLASLGAVGVNAQNINIFTNASMKQTLPIGTVMYDQPVLLTGLNASQNLGPINVSATAWSSRDKELDILVKYFTNVNASTKINDALTISAGIVALENKIPTGDFVPRSMVYGRLNANLFDELSADVSARKGLKNFGDGYTATAGFNYKNPNTSIRGFGTMFDDFAGRNTTKIGGVMTLSKSLGDGVNLFCQGEYIRNIQTKESNTNARIGLRYNIK